MEKRKKLLTVNEVNNDNNLVSFRHVRRADAKFE